VHTDRRALPRGLPLCPPRREGHAQGPQGAAVQHKWRAAVEVQWYLLPKLQKGVLVLPLPLLLLLPATASCAAATPAQCASRACAAAVSPQGSCKDGDACQYAHGVFEVWLHPSRFRTELCKDGPNCSRKVGVAAVGDRLPGFIRSDGVLRTACDTENELHVHA
jgi:hypothetical protein